MIVILTRANGDHCKRVLKYVKQTCKIGLMYKSDTQSSDSNVKTYSDADFAGNRDKRKSGFLKDKVLS